MKTLTEFQEAARKAGLRGPAWIERPRHHLGLGISVLTLSMRNGENDMITAANFDEHQIKLAHSPCSRRLANALHQGRGYFLKELS